MRRLFHSRRPSGHHFILATGPALFLATLQVHMLSWVPWHGALGDKPQTHPIAESCSGEDTGPFHVAGRAFVPRKPSWWAEATAAAASLPTLENYTECALPTGCQEMPCWVLKRSHLLRLKNNDVPAAASLPFPPPPPPCPGKSTGSVNKSLDSRSCPI